MKSALRWIVVVVVFAGIGVGFWRYRVAHHVSGRVQKLYADWNSPVKKGQLVAKIDPQLFQAAVQQSQANYMQAKAGVVTAEATSLNADRQYARTKALHDQNLAAQADLDTAEATAAEARASIDSAKANLAQAAASLNQAQVNLSYTNIISPIDGVVISRSVDTGQTVAASLSAPTLFTIAQDLTKMQVDTSVAEGDVGRLQVGMKTFFTVDAFPGQRFVGKIRQIRNSATTLQNVVTYDAVIDVDNEDLRLRPGMTANVTITYAERRETLAITNAALRYRGPAPAGGSASPSGSHRRGGNGGPGGGGGGGRGGANGGNGGAGAGAAPSASGASDEPPPPETHTIWVLRDGAPQSVAIHTGLSDGSVTEVVDGDVKEGDLVIVDATGSDVAPTATTTSNPFRGRI
jgi:HlyD family secretion protein